MLFVLIRWTSRKQLQQLATLRKRRNDGLGDRESDRRSFNGKSLSEEMKSSARALKAWRYSLSNSWLLKFLLVALANNLAERLRQRGVLFDLDEAIELHRAALALCAADHPRRSRSLNNFAKSLRDRFNYPHRSRSSNDLANSLHTRIEQDGIRSDLSEAIELNRAALALRLAGRSGNFATTLSTFEPTRGSYQQGILSDLNGAIEVNRALLALRPTGHPRRVMPINNLADSLQGRFQQLGILPGLNEAIELHRDALSLRPFSNPDRSTSFNSLAISLLDRFQQHGRSSDLKEAFSPHLQVPEVSHMASRGDLRVAKPRALSAEYLKHSIGCLSDRIEITRSACCGFVIIFPPSRYGQGGHFRVPCHGCFIMRCSLWSLGDCCRIGGARPCSILDPVGALSHPLDDRAISGDAGGALGDGFKQWKDIVGHIIQVLR
ncbi:hypothetical protein DEU56DRAFT_915738 [Suillus clintonianus]|uniref:uncharacterized protein n=1 Tax=Suillus clintonianus TaxID=1904413 RepID=UPI001B8851F4|nr:uncharacterized protein DEU56DRAFT_915738 [Suillus clintonianus]KAG2127526.1 hypothetical protein DEU56DRAFT_915738 [Suillus clintonianus]